MSTFNSPNLVIRSESAPDLIRLFQSHGMTVTVPITNDAGRVIGEKAIGGTIIGSGIRSNIDVNFYNMGGN